VTTDGVISYCAFSVENIENAIEKTKRKWSQFWEPPDGSGGIFMSSMISDEISIYHKHNLLLLKHTKSGRFYILFGNWWINVQKKNKTNKL
jgi:hypothetical protein